MAADPTRAQALRAAGIGATVDTEDPPGKVTVVFDLADFDALVGKLVNGRPANVVDARAAGYEQGRSDAESVAGLNVRRALVVDLVRARRQGTLDALVTELASGHNVPTVDAPPPNPRIAGVDRTPSTGPLAKGRLRTP